MSIGVPAEGIELICLVWVLAPARTLTEDALVWYPPTASAVALVTATRPTARPTAVAVLASRRRTVVAAERAGAVVVVLIGFSST
jgi:hypothetical protein